MREYMTKLDLAEKVIIQSIASGEIAPGEQLRQVDLADRLGVSATPVREALRRLEAQGLVVRDPHRGVRVVEVEPEGMAELYVIRAALEGLAVEHAVPNVSAKTLRTLEAIQNRLRRARESGGLKRMQRANFEFHTMLYGLSNLPRLIRIIDSLWPLFPWDSIWAVPGRAESSQAEHDHIIAAIRSGDAHAAGQAMREHIDHGAAMLVEFHERIQEPPEKAPAEDTSANGSRPRATTKPTAKTAPAGKSTGRRSGTAAGNPKSAASKPRTKTAGS